MRDPYYWRTLGYHVWGIFERADCNMLEDSFPLSEADTLIESVGARGRGDAAAKQYCRDRVAALNAGISVDNSQDEE